VGPRRVRELTEGLQMLVDAFGERLCSGWSPAQSWQVAVCSCDRTGVCYPRSEAEWDRAVYAN